MTNERHEKALEAAANVYFDFCRTCEHSPKEDAAAIIAAYLQAMGAVICEATPKAFLVSDFADGAYLTRSLKAAEKSDHHFDALHPALPNHFTNGE